MYTSKIRILFIAFASISLIGCSSWLDSKKFKKLGAQLSPSQQVSTSKKLIKKNLVNVKHKAVAPMNHDCSYIIRDLSIPNAKDVWCVPKHKS